MVWFEFLMCFLGVNKIIGICKGNNRIREMSNGKIVRKGKVI